MKVRYIGPDLGTTGFIDGKIYEVLEIDELSGALRIVDESGEEDGYLYDPKKPAMLDIANPGSHFEIVEDDAGGSLAKAING